MVTPRVTDSDTGNRCSHTACASPHRRPTPHTTCEACLHRPTPQPLMEGTEGAGASDMWGLPPEQPLGEGPSDVVWHAHSSTTRGGAGASSIWSQPDTPLGEGSSDVAWPAYSSTTHGLGSASGGGVQRHAPMLVTGGLASPRDVHGDDDRHVVRSCDGEIHFEWDERARTLKPTVENAEPHAPDQAPVARIPLCNSVVMWYTSPSNVAGIVSNDRRDSMQAWAFGHTNEAQTVRNVATPGAKPDVLDMSKVKLQTEALANDLQPPTRKTRTIQSLRDVVLRNRQQMEGVPLTNVELYRLMKEFEDFNDVECPSDGESSWQPPCSAWNCHAGSSV